MSERAIEFVELWVSKHIRDGAPDGDAKALAAQCLAAAKSEGISPSEMEDAFEDLTAFMAGELEEAKLARKGG